MPSDLSRHPAASAPAGKPGLRLLQWLYLVAALLYCGITPPFQAPDEPFHFYKAYQISLGHAVSVAGEDSMGYPLPAAIVALAERDFALPDQHTLHRYRVADVLAAWRRDAEYGEPVFVAFPNMAPYAPSMYAPQALGIVIGRQLGLPPIGLFYLGRIANAVTGALLVALAAALMPFGKGILLAFAAMPMTLTQFGSLSADASIIGLGFLVIALALRATMPQPRRLGRGEAWLSPCAITALALSKGVYLPLAAAGFLPLRRLTPRHWLLLGCMALGAVAFVAWLAYGQGAEIRFSVVSRKTLERGMTARPAEQLAVILAAPLQYLQILVTSILDRLPVYVLGVIGRFGWNAILLPIPLYLLAISVVALALIAPIGPVWRPQPQQRAWWLAIGLGEWVLVETALYLTGTPLGADYIQGTQGRYFLPFLPLLALACAVPLAPDGRWGRLARRSFPICVAVLVAVPPVVALNAFWVTGFKRALSL
jgi:uncharacterized membrane protein